MFEPFVGRERELAELDRPSVDDGRPRISVVTGEPGIGKTSLVAEHARRIHGRGGVVLQGRCSLEALRPYEPFATALLGHRTAVGDRACRDLLDDLAPRLAALVPDWREEPAAPSRDPEDRLALSHALGEAVDRLGAGRPLLLVLDDLQWARTESLEMLRHLAEAPLPQAPSIVITVRPLGTVGDAVREALDDLESRAGARVIELGGLDASSIDQLVERSGLPHVAGAASSLLERTAGNPLYVTQILAHARIGGSLDTLPQSLLHLLTQRVSALSPAATAVIEHAALAGTEFPVVVCQRSAPTADEVLSALDEAATEGIVQPGSAPGQLAFAHALLREAVVHAIPPERQAQLHRAIAETLEDDTSTDPGERAAAVAFHWSRADGDDAAERCLTATIAAAALAVNRVAPEDAITSLGRALEATRGRQDLAVGRSDALLLTAVAHADLGESNRSRAAARAAAAACPADEAAAERFARAAYVRAEIAEIGSPDPEAQALVTEALERIGDRHPRWRIRLLQAQATMQLIAEGAPEAALATLDRALDEARTLGDPELLAEVHAGRAVALRNHSPDIDDALAAARERLRLVALVPDTEPETGDPVNDCLEPRIGERGGLYAQRALAWVLLEGAEPEFDAAVDATELLVHADRTHADAKRTIAALRIAQYLMRGRFDEAEELVQEALANLGELNDQAAATLGGLFVLRREQGRLDEVLPLARDLLRARRSLSILFPGLILADIETGQTAHAQEAALRRLSESLPVGVTRLAEAAMLAEALAALEMDVRSNELYEWLRPWAGRLITMGNTGAVIGSTDRALGQLALVRSDIGAARAHLDAAIAVEQRVDARALVARSTYWAARAHMAGPEPDLSKADRLIDVAQSEAEALGMAQLAAQAASVPIADASVLVTILFTDIVESTPLAARLGDVAWRELLEQHDALMERTAARFHGRLVQFTGDGYLTELPTPTLAARAAAAMVHGAERLGFQLRAGLHTGECTRRGDDLSGVSIHLAARIGAAAGPGAVVMSDTFRALISRAGLRTTSLGTQQLKGIAHPVELFSLDLDDA